MEHQSTSKPFIGLIGFGYWGKNILRNLSKLGVLHTAVIKLKELISSGALGKIQYIYSNRLNIGKLRTEENILWSFAPDAIMVGVPAKQKSWVCKCGTTLKFKDERAVCVYRGSNYQLSDGSLTTDAYR